MMRVWLWILAAALLVSISSPKPQETCPVFCRCYLFEGLRRADCRQVPMWAGLVNDAQDVRIIPAPGGKASRSSDLRLSHFEVFPKVLQLSVTNRSIVEVIPGGFHVLRNLQQLDLSFNQISGFNDKVFRWMTSLRTLILQGNPIILEPNRTLVMSRSLRSLDLSFCGLSQIPKGSLDGVKNLTSLSLRGNAITFKTDTPLLPFKSLLELDLSSCKLHSIPPKAFGNLANLRRLYLDGNYLQTIVEGVLPKGLHSLDLSSNQIQHVPTDVISSFRNLSKLEMSGNPIMCTCALIGFQGWMARHLIVAEKPVICADPEHYRGLKWTEVNELELCRSEGSFDDYSSSQDSSKSSDDSDSSDPLSSELSSSPPGSYEAYFLEENVIRHRQPAIKLDRLLESKSQINRHANNEENSIQSDQPYSAPSEVLADHTEKSEVLEDDPHSRIADSSESRVDNQDASQLGDASANSKETNENPYDSYNDATENPDAEVFMRNSDTIAMGKSMPADKKDNSSEAETLNSSAEDVADSTENVEKLSTEWSSDENTTVESHVTESSTLENSGDEIKGNTVSSAIEETAMTTSAETQTENTPLGKVDSDYSTEESTEVPTVDEKRSEDHIDESTEYITTEEKFSTENTSNDDFFTPAYEKNDESTEESETATAPVSSVDVTSGERSHFFGRSFEETSSSVENHDGLANATTVISETTTSVMQTQSEDKESLIREISVEDVTPTSSSTALSNNSDDSIVVDTPSVTEKSVNELESAVNVIHPSPETSTLNEENEAAEVSSPEPLPPHRELDEEVISNTVQETQSPEKIETKEETTPIAEEKIERNSDIASEGILQREDLLAVGKIHLTPDDNEEDSDNDTQQSAISYIVVGAVLGIVLILIAITLIRNKGNKKDGKQQMRIRRDDEDPGTEMKDMMNPLLEPTTDQPVSSEFQDEPPVSLELINEGKDEKASNSNKDQVKVSHSPKLNGHDKNKTPRAAKSPPSPNKDSPEGKADGTSTSSPGKKTHTQPGSPAMANGKTSKHNGTPTVASKVKVVASVIPAPVPSTPIIVHHGHKGANGVHPVNGTSSKP